MKKALLLLSLLVLTVSLTACGGSSGSSDSTPASLTGAVVAAPISGMDIYIGSEYTTADQDLKIGVTNATGAIEFDKAVVAQIAEYPVVIATRGAGKNIKAKNTLDIVLSGIMMSATDSVYLTPFGTVAAGLFEAKKVELGATAAATFAKDAVKDIVKDTFGSPVNPFANPLANNDALMAHEILTQSFLATIAFTEGVDAATAFSTKMGNIISDISDGKAYSTAGNVGTVINANTSVANFLNANRTAIAVRVANTLTELTSPTDPDAAAKKLAMQAEAEADTPMYTEITKSIAIVASSGTSNYIEAKAVPAALDVVVSIKTNQKNPTTNTATFKITKLPENGTFGTTAAPTVGLPVDDTPYNSNTTFKFTPEVAAQDYTFTFETIPAAGEKALTTTLTLKAVAAKTVIATKAVASVAKNLIPFVDATKDFATIKKDSVADLVTGDIKATVTFDAITADEDKDKVAEKIAVRFTAPAGFAFKKGTETPVSFVDVPEMKDAKIAANVAIYQITDEYKLIVIKEGTANAGKLSFAVEVIAAKDATNVANVPFRADNDAKIVLYAEDTEDAIQSFEIVEGTSTIKSTGLIDTADSTHLLNGAIDFRAKTWKTTANGARPGAATLTDGDWEAGVVTPEIVAGATPTTGFGIEANVKADLDFATAGSGNISIADKGAKDLYTATFENVKFTFADNVETTEFDFSYDPGAEGGDDQVSTATDVAVKKVDYVAPVVLVLTPEMVATSPTAAALGNIEVVDPTANLDLSGNTHKVYVAKVVTTKIADETELANSWVASFENSKVTEFILDPVKPVVAKVVGGYTLTFTASTMKAAEEDAAEIIKFTKDTAVLTAYNVALKNDNESD